MYSREASALDLFTDSVRLMGDATLCAVMVFNRRLDPGTLEDAAQACLMAHPVLHSRLVRGNGAAFWEMDGAACVPPVIVEECIEDYHPQVTGPVDPYGPLQFRVRLLRRPSGDVIVINLAHAAADAFGLHMLMSQLLLEYQKPGSVRPASGGIPERDTLWTRELEPGKTSLPDEMNVINPMWPNPFGTSGGPTSYHRECITPSVLEAIRSHTKKAGGNINDAVMAAYFLSMSDLTGYNGPIDIFFPVNLRQHLNDGSRVMSNQAVNVSFVLRRVDGEGMHELLPRVIEGTRQLKSGYIGIPEQVEMDRASDPEGRQVHRMVEKMVALQDSGLADIFISNPGPVVLPEVDGLVDAYVCYPGGYMPTTCFITSSFRGRMTITMGYQDGGTAKAGTRRAMDLFMHHLLSLTDGS
ncbi:MAG: hypothetical protein LUQ66_08675 [Methanoregula sp.]|nr:hypothetical protein [Methanoregula sp.]